MSTPKISKEKRKIIINTVSYKSHWGGSTEFIQNDLLIFKYWIQNKGLYTSLFIIQSVINIKFGQDCNIQRSCKMIDYNH